MKDSSLQSLLQLFFTDRLLKQLGVSPHTVAAYRLPSACCSSSRRNASGTRPPNCEWKTSTHRSWGSPRLS